MKIKNKQQSSKLIKELNLNQFNEQILKSTDKDVFSKIEKYFEENPVEYYILRDKKDFNSKISKKLKKEEVFEKYQDLEIFSIDVAAYNFREFLVLSGQICLKNNEIYYTVTSNKDSEKGSFEKSGKIDIFDKKVLKVNGMREIIDYIYKHNLLNYIVEFAIFDKPLGKNNERIVIFELRTDY